MNSLITDNQQEINKICKKNNVASLYIFGSALTSSFNNESDVDFLISFKKGISIKKYTDSYFELQYQFRKLLNRNIDLVTENSLSNPYFIKDIEASKQLVYAV